MRWEEVITSTYMTHNSGKAWKTMRKLSNDPTTSIPLCLVSANQVAHQLDIIINSKCSMPSTSKHSVLPTSTKGDTFVVYPFSEEQYRKVVALLKTTKSLEEMTFWWSN